MGFAVGLLYGSPGTLVSNKKTGVTWGGDAVSSEDEDVDLPGEQDRQIGVRGAGVVLAAGFLLRLVLLGFLLIL